MTVRELLARLENFHKDWEFDVLIPPAGADPEDRVLLRLNPPEPTSTSSILVTALPAERITKP